MSVSDKVIRLFEAIKVQYGVDGKIDPHKKSMLLEELKKLNGRETLVQEIKKTLQLIDNGDDLDDGENCVDNDRGDYRNNGNDSANNGNTKIVESCCVADRVQIEKKKSLERKENDGVRPPTRLRLLLHWISSICLNFLAISKRLQFKMLTSSHQQQPLSKLRLFRVPLMPSNARVKTENKRRNERLKKVRK